jgi:cobalt/nickel transport system ATP-binding protein
MDEPSSNLDPGARRRLINLLLSFQHTKIIATHDLDMVMDLCPRTIVFHQGKIAGEGPTEEIFRDTALLEACGLETIRRMQPCPACGHR